MPVSSLKLQLGRVRRRLFLGTLLACLVWCWVLALVGAVGWFFLEPYLVPEASESLRFLVLALLLVLATLLGFALALRRRPSRVAAALALDERFSLHERVTTSLTLGPAETLTPAGRALLADVEARVAPLRVGERFPIRLPGLPLALLSVVGLALALVASFWTPRVRSAADDVEDVLAAAGVKEDVDEQMKKLAAPPRGARPEPAGKAEDLERIAAEIEKFTRRPRDTREEVRERIKDATALEEQIRQEQKEQADRLDAFQEAMKQVERLTRKKREERKDGPARRAADALARADMTGAEDELLRLSRRLEKEEEKERLRRKKRDEKATDEERKQAEEELKKLDREQGMTEEEREQLEKQIAQMEDDLKRLSRREEEREKELRDLARRGEIEKDELDRELDELKRTAQELKKDQKEIEELARELGECRKCMNEGKDGEAGQKLARAARRAGKLGKDPEDKELARKLAQVQAVKRALCRSLTGQAGQASGRRPEKKDETSEKTTPIRGEWDRGKLEVVGQGPIGGFHGPRRPAEMQLEIRQAAQEAPAAIDRQRLPPQARKMARGYFEKMRGQVAGEKKK